MLLNQEEYFTLNKENVLGFVIGGCRNILYLSMLNIFLPKERLPTLHFAWSLNCLVYKCENISL